MEQDKLAEAIDGLSAFMDVSEIHGYTVKEWSTSQFTRLYPYLSLIVKTLIEGGATFDNFKSYLTENLPQLLDAVVPHMAQLIIISCPGKTEKDIENLPWTDGVEVVLFIFKKNMDHVADFFVRKSVQMEKIKTDKKISS